MVFSRYYLRNFHGMIHKKIVEIFVSIFPEIFQEFIEELIWQLTLDSRITPEFLTVLKHKSFTIFFQKLFIHASSCFQSHFSSKCFTFCLTRNSSRSFFRSFSVNFPGNSFTIFLRNFIIISLEILSGISLEGFKNKTGNFSKHLPKNSSEVYLDISQEMTPQVFLRDSLEIVSQICLEILLGISLEWFKNKFVNIMVRIFQEFLEELFRKIAPSVIHCNFLLFLLYYTILYFTIFYRYLSTNAHMCSSGYFNWIFSNLDWQQSRGG